MRLALQCLALNGAKQELVPFPFSKQKESMALHLCHLQPRPILPTPQAKHSLTRIEISHTTLRLWFSQSPRLNRFAPLKSSAFNDVSIKNIPQEPDRFRQLTTSPRLQRRLSKWIRFLRSILPGGSWWNLSDHVEVVVLAKPVTVVKALHRMWQLVQNDRWVIFIAFSALIIAALSEISIPHFLTASVFTAQSGEIAVFHQNVRLLILLCITSGICSGLRGCCFGIANMILVKRMRETLYATLLFQGGGALIYLLILSWPLGLCTLAICSTLAAIMLFYGQYRRWLQILADISLRQSAAYGFWNLSFNTLYHSMQVPVLQQVNLTVRPNEVVAIVGLSGSGKSTLVNLLLRLYEPTDGQILIDGFPLRELDIKWFRERIGYVGQEPRLFRTDISSNIRYGCTRDITQEDVEWAAKQAYAHDFISSLPNGYKTLVDDDLLSGGQKQRIAIARAILRNPAILILDEATSALDAESEHNVKGVLRAVGNDLKTKRSVVVIAHRLSTIQAADRIVVMEGGKIVEMGSHAELLRGNGLFARLTERQADAVVS
ncbi:ABC transporter-like, ATP-binding domain [Dillenia turbinata]|uniref:ABC transporter-like, ATP-binding domain n=1 Tax=Dillenia turbinata TaxID=194707 RepID=A0AAN8ZEN2_9MAGN